MVDHPLHERVLGHCDSDVFNHILLHRSRIIISSLCQEGRLVSSIFIVLKFTHSQMFLVCEMHILRPEEHVSNCLWLIKAYDHQWVSQNQKHTHCMSTMLLKSKNKREESIKKVKIRRVNLIMLWQQTSPHLLGKTQLKWLGAVRLLKVVERSCFIANCSWFQLLVKSLWKCGVIFVIYSLFLLHLSGRVCNWKWRGCFKCIFLPPQWLHQNALPWLYQRPCVSVDWSITLIS